MPDTEIGDIVIIDGKVWEIIGWKTAERIVENEYGLKISSGYIQYDLANHDMKERNKDRFIFKETDDPKLVEYEHMPAENIIMRYNDYDFELAAATPIEIAQARMKNG